MLGFRKASRPDALAINTAIAPASAARRSRRSASGKTHVRVTDGAPADAPAYTSPGARAWEDYGYRDLARTIRNICTVTGWSHAPEGPGGILAITSPAAGDGKTSLATAMAISLALDHACGTLLVECDLLRPRLADTFAVSSHPGLSEVIGGDASIDRALKRTRLENLHILPAGELPENGSRLLRSPAMRSTLDECRQRFGFIILDLAGTLETSDTAVLAAQADGVILVARANATDRHDIQRALHGLAGTTVRGVVLNDWHAAVPGMVMRLINP